MAAVMLHHVSNNLHALDVMISCAREVLSFKEAHRQSDEHCLMQSAYRSELVLLAASPLLQVVHDLIFIPEASDPAPIHKLLHVKDAFI